MENLSGGVSQWEASLQPQCPHPNPLFSSIHFPIFHILFPSSACLSARAPYHAACPLPCPSSFNLLSKSASSSPQSSVFFHTHALFPSAFSLSCPSHVSESCYKLTSSLSTAPPQTRPRGWDQSAPGPTLA